MLLGLVRVVAGWECYGSGMEQDRQAKVVGLVRMEHVAIVLHQRKTLLLQLQVFRQILNNLKYKKVGNE